MLTTILVSDWDKPPRFLGLAHNTSIRTPPLISNWLSYVSAVESPALLRPALHHLFLPYSSRSATPAGNLMWGQGF